MIELLPQAEAKEAELVSTKSVLIAVRVHPFPFRTRKLSSPMPKILVWRRTGKIGQCQHLAVRQMPGCFLFICICFPKFLILTFVEYYSIETIDYNYLNALVNGKIKCTDFSQ